jgi:DNA-binding beta-propeller fold protein YncE
LTARRPDDYRAPAKQGTDPGRIPTQLARNPYAPTALVLPVVLGLVLVAVTGPPAGAGVREPEATVTGPVGRLAQPAGGRGCIHKTGVNRCAAGRAVNSPEDIAISPDGRHAYVAAYGSHAVAVFARNRTSGGLVQLPGKRGCIGHRGAGPCAYGRALARPVAVAVSPDGRNVYVAAAGSNALAVFSRNRRTGALRQLAGTKGCVSHRPGGGCVDGRALNEPVAVAVSPRGGRVYVAARRHSSAVAIFVRGRDGSLAQRAGESGCVAQGTVAGCAPARAMRSPEDVAVSPDGRSIYVAAMKSNAVTVLRRSPDGLSQPAGTGGCITNRGATGCARGKALGGPVDLAVAPDGRGLYVASSIGDAVAVLRSDRATGALSQARGRVGCVSQAGGGGRCIAGRMLDEVWSVAISPDGRNVYAVSARVNGMGITARSRTTGRLTPLRGRFGCLIRGGVLGCPEGRGLTVAVAVTVSPDGRNVYVASDDLHLGAIAIFRRSVR